MPKQPGQRPKLLLLMHILYQQTDEDHRLSVTQLTEQLAALGIPCERKSIYSDIETLRELGCNIELRRGPHGGYWVSHRRFELPELKLLVDAVQASRFIPEKKCRELIRKLEGLASTHMASQLQRQVYVTGRPRTGGQQIWNNVDRLHEAISTGKMVTFGYQKSDGQLSHPTVSPWQMAWDGGYYYLIAYQDQATPSGIRHYRVDRMKSVACLSEPRRGQKQFASFDLAQYLRSRFQMFGGEEVRVTLRCTNAMQNTMRERFGTGPIFVEEPDGHFHFDTNIVVSPPFFGWVMGFGGQVEILHPQSVRTQMRDAALACAQAHSSPDPQ